jgi:hypothetical protein
MAYANRGDANKKSGYIEQAISDYRTAARLGHKKVQDYLRAKGIGW